MTFTVTTEQFEGPMALLLSLIEKKELDISSVSLASITEDYVAHLGDVERVAPHELADFLVIASRLLYLKSRALLPEADLEMEEEGALENQLRMYERYAKAARVIEDMLQDGREAYAAPRQKMVEEVFAPPEAVTGAVLKEALLGVMERVRPYLELPKQLMERVVSVEEKIMLLKEHIEKKARGYFHDMVERGSRADVVTGFLALLELLKQQFVRVEQGGLFEDIAVERV